MGFFNMLYCPASRIEYRDIIGFEKNAEFVAGKVVFIGTVEYPKRLEWHIKIELADGTITYGVFDSKETVQLIAMEDAENPARTRNNKSLWPSLGIFSK